MPFDPVVVVCHSIECDCPEGKRCRFSVTDGSLRGRRFIRLTQVGP